MIFKFTKYLNDNKDNLKKAQNIREYYEMLRNSTCNRLHHKLPKHPTRSDTPKHQPKSQNFMSRTKTL